MIRRRRGRRYRRRRLRESLYYRFKLYCCRVTRDPARLRTQYAPVGPKTHTTVAAILPALVSETESAQKCAAPQVAGVRSVVGTI